MYHIVYWEQRARIEEGPAVGRELAEPVAEQVEQELEGEDDGEAEVGRVQGLLDESVRTVVLADLVRFQLRLEDGDAEVLLKATGSCGWHGLLMGEHWQCELNKPLL